MNISRKKQIQQLFFTKRGNKLVNVMKIAALLTFFFSFQLIAVNSYSQSTRLSLYMESSKIKDVLMRIENQSEFYFLYNGKLVDVDKTVSINAENQTVSDILSQLFDNKEVAVKIIDRQIVLLPASMESDFNAVAYFQGITITGTVTDSDGEPLPGVNVMIKGTTQGTATDAEGRFSINVPDDNSTLVFSYIGHAIQELLVGNRRVINIILSEMIREIDEVVVIGYGTQKKANLTGAVASVSGKVLEDRPITTVGSGLQGVIPNLKITPLGNAPGQGTSFNIRGYTSLNGGGPLVLIDGVVQDPNLINPSDIESVSVLKDASSAAIYGARAAYGVILLTTKSGNRNQKPTFNFSVSNAGASPLHLQHTLNSLDYVNLMNLSARNSGQGNIFDERQVQHIEAYLRDPKNNLPVYYDPLIETTGEYGYCGNTDWADVVYKNGGLQQYNISMSGGSENTRYFISYGLQNQQGILNIYDDKDQRHTINTDLTTDIKKWITFGAKVKYTYRHEDHPAGGTRGAVNAYAGPLGGDLPPFMPVTHPDGSYSGQGTITNPMAVGRLAGSDHYKVNDFWVTGKITLRPFTGLNVNADFTFNPYSWNRTLGRKRFMEKRADGTEYVYPWVRDDGVTMENRNDYYTATNVYVDYTANTGKSNFKITAGYNQEIKTYQYFNAQRLNLIDKDLPIISLATGIQTVNGDATSWAVQGLFGRFHYDYAEKYLIDINGRYDGSSKFAEGYRFAVFPSFGVGWYISKEDFMKGINPILSDLKLRGSYGNLGNQNINTNFSYVPDYGITLNQEYLVNNERGVAITAPGLVSADLTWEKVTQWNIAVDFGLLKDRLTGSFDVFSRNTIGMLTGAQPLPGVLGTNVPNANAADLKTEGWELILRWNDQIKGAGIDYYVSFVLSDALAEITKYENPTGTLSSGHYVGKKIGEIWGYKSNGLFQSYDEIAAAPNQNRLYNGTWHPGDVRYVKLDNSRPDEISPGSNTLSDPGDRAIIGNTTPRYEYGITLGVSWKGLDFESFLQGVGKRNWWPEGRYFGVDGRWSVPTRMIDSYWTEDNPNGFLPKQYQESRGNRQTSSRYLQDASYLRFKQLTIGYTLPDNWIGKISFDKIRLYFTGQNIFTWTKLSKLYDPEVVGEAGRATDIVTNSVYPVARFLSFGMNITF